VAASENSTMPRRADTRVRDRLLILLTISTGAVDAVSWLGLEKVFSAFMTGNVIFVGLRIAGAEGPPVHLVLASLAGFAVGALLAARIVTPGVKSGAVWPRPVTAVLGGVVIAQCAFLAMWLSVGGHPSTALTDVLLAVSAFAMGMQTAAMFSLGVRAVFTTAATATWAVLMGDLSGWEHPRGEQRRLATVVAGLLTGAVAGGILVAHARAYAPLLPLALTGLVVSVAEAVERRTGAPTRGRDHPISSTVIPRSNGGSPMPAPLASADARPNGVQANAPPT
jgi:uncharacterized membrane protein YoaK (UPF0700 family)